MGHILGRNCFKIKRYGANKKITHMYETNSEKLNDIWYKSENGALNKDAKCKNFI